ncbi:three-helix bundle dimerization domain-containing protein [Corynebacterium tapiri]|uniref:three-helix bundle dimerization domain-containing protein n=1 Tax=Corynebacterium tapiri TaxID=1448266 RepID=UPI0015D58C18|nr:hypothetical protein [Corynebacterium tapiri]
MTINQILATVREDIHNRYDYALHAEQVDAVLDTVIEEHLGKAEMLDLVPVLVERDASERLEEMLLDGSVHTLHRARRIVFVNRSNRIMAELAAAMTRAVAGTSALVTVAATDENVASDIKLESVARRRSLPLTFEENRERRALNSADVTVYLDEAEAHDMGGRREVVWNIASTENKSGAEIDALADDLQARVEELLAELGIVAPQIAAA